MAVVVYLLAGLFAAWAFDRDPPWKRALLVLVWLPMFAWNLVVDALDWANRHTYHYPTDEPEADDGSQDSPDSPEWQWP